MLTLILTLLLALSFLLYFVAFAWIGVKSSRCVPLLAKFGQSQSKWVGGLCGINVATLVLPIFLWASISTFYWGISLADLSQDYAPTTMLGYSLLYMYQTLIVTGTTVGPFLGIYLVVLFFATWVCGGISYLVARSVVSGFMAAHMLGGIAAFIYFLFNIIAVT